MPRGEKKEKMVTRTIITTNCEVVRVNLTTSAVIKETVVLTGKHDNTPETLVLVKKHDTPEVATAAIASVSYEETLYGMPESTFIQHAVVLPPRKAQEDAES